MALVRDVLCYTSRVFSVTLEDMAGRVRTRDLVAARQAACYVARQVTGTSFDAIGSKLKRHHTTVMHSVDACIIYMQRDPVYRAKVRRIRKLARRGKKFAAVAYVAPPKPVLHVVFEKGYRPPDDMDLLSAAVARYAAQKQSERMSA